MCRLPCERRERLRATEVVRVALVRAARPRRRQSPRSRYGGAATASKLPNREFSSGITGAHVTGAERLGDYIREYGIELDELKISIFPNRAIRVCKHYFNRRGIFFMEIGKWWNGDDIRYLLRHVFLPKEFLGFKTTTLGHFKSSKYHVMMSYGG